MRSAKKIPPRGLGELEQLVMEHLWARGSTTAERCREALLTRHPMKDSTVRTILRRLEHKGFVRHEVDGRTFVYRPTQGRPNIAARSVRHIIERFCSGSVEQLLVGMVENDVLGHAELERLARKIARMKKGTT
ncbi:MAG TPA: BlaI/MecI/CopY family transcriptional regulator [Steroidobacteraceae bacterium]|nr:BlaI/MecI/CopY family transcriptional regulator [Steroidobacteraceae bacterium]